MARTGINRLLTVVSVASLSVSVLAVPVIVEPTTTFNVPAATAEPFLDDVNTYLLSQTATNIATSVTDASSTGTASPVSSSTPPVVPPGYQPLGGVGVNSSNPVYEVSSDYDRQSLILTLYQEWAQMDFLYDGFSTYSDADFTQAGLKAADRNLLGMMAEQEAGHANAINNLLGGNGPGRCTYNYPFQDVREFLDFGQKLTRWGESLIYGYLPHLESREAEQILTQVVSTVARQQLIFRQYNGLHPMPVLFEAGIPQAWAWTFLAPYIDSCNSSSERVMWENFPMLTVINQPNPARKDASKSWNETRHDPAGTQQTTDLTFDEACRMDCGPAIAHDRGSPLSYAGRDVFLQWDAPGEAVGPDNSYTTSTLAGAPLFAAWVSAETVTYTPLLDVSGNSAHTYQPNATTYGGVASINGTMYIAITDAEVNVTAFNLDRLNPHVVALGMYQAG